jgi:DNA-binding CsgD family transcriptional regulator
MSRKPLPWYWFRPGPERDAARESEKRRVQEARSRAMGKRRELLLAGRDAEIRRLWSEGVSNRELVERFGLAKSTISGIVASLPKRPRRFGDPWDVTWPYPRRRAPDNPAFTRASREFKKVEPLDPADILGSHAVGPKGSAHGRSKLTEEKVIEMRRLRSEGWTTPQLARRFGVSRNTACYAMSGATWKHVPGAIVPSRTDLDR